ncbi:preprotein translocase subunit SecG [Candidatus Microgenomates bacterium]|nr:preprotein translocase subunit SecG [Candidatus Microgenomates bacterium]
MLVGLQIALGILIIISILLQSRGSGLGGAWGGGGESYSTRRGVESVLFRATILFVTLFVIVSFALFLY